MFLDFYAGGVGGTDQVSFFDRGVVCGLTDLIEAHKWFALRRQGQAHAGIGADAEPTRGIAAIIEIASRPRVIGQQ